MASNISLAWAALLTGAWIGRVEASASVENGAAFSCWKSTQRFQSGRQSATVRNSIQVAKASFSQRSSHHSIVTRLPNHWWAISWATTSAMRFLAATEAEAESQ